MSIFRMRLPDVGEGVAEAELVSWLVAVGDEVTPDSVLAEVLTDKATVEVASPTSGVVTALHGVPGDVLAVGSDLVEIETAGADPEPESATEPDDEAAETAEHPLPHAANGVPAAQPLSDTPNRSSSGDDESDVSMGSGAGRARPTAAPAVRARARALGIDLATVPGSGPDGRVTHADLDRLLTGSGPPQTSSMAGPPADRAVEATTETVRGVRRRIAERLTATWSEVPHITYVDAVDVTELERLRGELNASSDAPDGTRLTTLAFVARATAIACSEQPRLNAHYLDDDRSLTTFGPVHLGIATQTDDGLLVPVVRRVETRGIWDLAAEIARVATAARDGSATREDLAGSTITITSLGALGGLVTTPLLNAPEVAIVGVNKIETRPVWDDGAFRPRRMMNLSSSFDHRVVDGWDAATFVQRIRSLLETPALLFVGHP